MGEWRSLYLGGSTCALSDGSVRPAPSGWWLDGLLSTLDRVAPRFASSGVLAIDPAACSDVEPPAAGEHGRWTASEPGAWQTFTRSGQTLQVVYLAQARRDRFPLWAGPADTAVALHQWHSLTGIAYRRTPGITGIDLLHQLYAGKAEPPTWRPRSEGPANRGQEWAYNGEQWHQEPTSRYVHVYDATRAYLAAAGNVEVCPWPLRLTGEREFDPKRAGWWYVDIAPWQLSDFAPDPAGYAVAPGPRWVTTPTLRLLDELVTEGVHGGYRVLDSWTGPARRVLEPWAAKLRDAYKLTGGIASPDERERLRTTLKMAGNAAIGLLANDNMNTYRPDWHHAIIATARANLFRKVWRCGRETTRWPLRIETDAVHYQSDQRDPVEAAPAGFKLDPFGTTLGTFRPERTFRVRKAATR